MELNSLEAHFEKLSERQLEILRLLSAHRTAKEIARALGISEYTVRAHATEGRKRLGAATLREAMILLAQYDARPGLVQNRQPQSDGIAESYADGAGSAGEHPPPREDDAVSPNLPDLAATDAGAPLRDGGSKPYGGLVWIYARLQASTALNWALLIGATALLVLTITVGILAGAGAVLQTIQDLGVRAR